MPKVNKRARKASSDESSSDSGPEDRNPPPEVKAKGKATPQVVKKAPQNNDEEPTWNLDKMRLVKVREFRGKVLIDIREFYEKDGNMLPGKKGISLSAAQWQKLKEITQEVDEAIKNK